MITYPNAKINIGLLIVDRRNDGYHDLETVFYPIPLHDVLEIVPAATVSLTCHGRTVDCPVEQNLVFKAWKLMHDRHGVPECEIHLYKHIPDGAGLGGGSSDASFTLMMLNEMFNVGLDSQALAALAVTLGADCPFFVYNKPMLAGGIGDRLTPLQATLSGYTMLLVKPHVHVSTREAYAGVSLMSKYGAVTPGTWVDVVEGDYDRTVFYNYFDLADFDKLVSHDVACAMSVTPLPIFLRLPLFEWSRFVVNEFERTVFAAHPVLTQVKQRLTDAGAVYAAMTGSGSALYGIFDNDNMAEKAREYFTDCDTFVMKL